MSTITLTNTLTNGTVADADEVMANFNDIVNVVNGSLDNTNVDFSVAPAIGGTTPNTGAFTTLSSTGQYTNSVADGTAPMVITSTTVVSNLNADKVDGKDASDMIETVTTITSSATPTPAISSYKTLYIVTALAEGATFGAPTGSPAQGYRLVIRIKDNGTARALSWNAIYREGSDVELPTTTVISKTMYLGFMYNSTDSKWDLLALVDNI